MGQVHVRVLLALVLAVAPAQGDAGVWRMRRLMQGDPNAGGLINTALTLDDAVTDAPAVTATGAPITNAQLTGAPLDRQLTTFANTANINETVPNQNSTLFQNVAGLATGDTDPQAAGAALVTATQTGNIADAAGGVLAVARDGSDQATQSLGVAISQLANTDVAGLGQVLGLSTLLAAKQGSSGLFINTAAQLFSINDQQDSLDSFAAGVADAINLAGAAGSVTWGNALAEAVVADPTNNNSSRTAVAKATASVLCKGGARAAAWASAFSVLLRQNADGCLVLDQARSLATAQCAGSASATTSQSTATTTVLGFCDLPRNSFAPQSVTGSSGGATVTGDGTADAGATGSTAVDQPGPAPLPSPSPSPSPDPFVQPRAETLPADVTASSPRPRGETLPAIVTANMTANATANSTANSTRNTTANSPQPRGETLTANVTGNTTQPANVTTNATQPGNDSRPADSPISSPVVDPLPDTGDGSSIPLLPVLPPMNNSGPSNNSLDVANSTVAVAPPVTNVTLVSATGTQLTGAALTAPAVQVQLDTFAATANITTTQPNQNTTTFKTIAALATGTNVAAAGAALVGAAQAGNVADAAGGVLSVATVGTPRARANAANAINQLANSNPTGCGQVLGLATLLSARQGRQANAAFVSTAAQLFNPANQPRDQPNAIKNLAAGVADAITNSGDAGAVTWGNAIAEALAGGDDGTRAAIAEASASVFCAGGCRASAWSSAISVALSQNKDGCLVVNQAASTAFATCQGNAAQSFTRSTATSTILGFCGYFGNLPPQFIRFILGSLTTSFTQTEASATATGNCQASAGGTATAGASPAPSAPAPDPSVPRWIPAPSRQG